jgi:hypothetical protein
LLNREFVLFVGKRFAPQLANCKFLVSAEPEIKLLATKVLAKYASGVLEHGRRTGLSSQALAILPEPVIGPSPVGARTSADTIARERWFYSVIVTSVTTITAMKGDNNNDIV